MAVSGVMNFSITGTDVLTLGIILFFLQLSRKIINPIVQIS